MAGGRLKRWWKGLETFLNSTVFHLFVGGLVVGAGGTWFGEYQACRKHGDEIGPRFLHLEREIGSRQEQYAAILGTSKTLAEITERLGKVPYTYLEFKGRTTRDLIGDTLTLRREIDVGEWIAQDVKLSPTFKGRDFFQFAGFWVGEVPFSVTDADVPALRQFSVLLYKIGAAASVDNFTWRDNCSAPTLIRWLLGDESAKIVTILDPHAELMRHINAP